MRWEREFPRWPSAKTVRAHFGSFSEGLQAAGLPASRRRPELPLAERIATAKRLGSGGHSQAQIAQILGVGRRTVRDYLSAGSCPVCGGPKVLPESPTCRPCAPAHRRWARWERDELLLALRAWAKETGRRPSSHAWQPIDLGGEQKWEHEHPRWPPSSLVIAEFGSFSNALRQADLGLNRHDWDDEQILELMRAFQRAHGRPPTGPDWQSTNGGANPPATLVASRFGSWSAALRAAGLPHNRHGPWTREQIIAALKRFAAEYGRPPRTVDLRGQGIIAQGYPSASATQRAFGDFSRAIRAADLEPGNPPPVSGDEALHALRRFHEARGHHPTAAQWRREALRPGTTTIIRRFGRWSRAIAAAEADR